jgi:hypothetical protein
MFHRLLGFKRDTRYVMFRSRTSTKRGRESGKRKREEEGRKKEEEEGRKQEKDGKEEKRREKDDPTQNEHELFTWTSPPRPLPTRPLSSNFP